MMRQEDWERLHKQYPNIGYDLPVHIDISTEDTDTIMQAFSRSKWLRRNVRSLYRIYKWLPRLASGYYDDYIDPNKTEKVLEREHITAEELNALFIRIGENESNDKNKQ